MLPARCTGAILPDARGRRLPPVAYQSVTLPPCTGAAHRPACCRFPGGCRHPGVVGDFPLCWSTADAGTVRGELAGAADPERVYRSCHMLSTRPSRNYRQRRQTTAARRFAPCWVGRTAAVPARCSVLSSAMRSGMPSSVRFQRGPPLKRAAALALHSVLSPVYLFTVIVRVLLAVFQVSRHLLPYRPRPRKDGTSA